MDDDEDDEEEEEPAAFFSALSFFFASCLSAQLSADAAVSRARLRVP